MTQPAANSSPIAVYDYPHDALVSGNVREFKQEMETHCQNAALIVVNLAPVQFIDSAGCAALLQFFKRLRKKNGNLALCGISPSVRAMFELVRIQRVLDIFPSVDQAVAALQASSHS